MQITRRFGAPILLPGERWRWRRSSLSAGGRYVRFVAFACCGAAGPQWYACRVGIYCLQDLVEIQVVYGDSHGQSHLRICVARGGDADY